MMFWRLKNTYKKNAGEVNIHCSTAGNLFMNVLIEHILLLRYRVIKLIIAIIEGFTFVFSFPIWKNPPDIGS